MAATARPWRKTGLPVLMAGSGVDSVGIADCRTVDMTEDQAHDNARFIVRAVNCHDELVAACQAALAKFEEYYASRTGATPEAVLKLKTVLSKVDGG